MLSGKDLEPMNKFIEQWCHCTRTSDEQMIRDLKEYYQTDSLEEACDLFLSEIS